MNTRIQAARQDLEAAHDGWDPESALDTEVCKARIQMAQANALIAIAESLHGIDTTLDKIWGSM